MIRLKNIREMIFPKFITFFLLSLFILISSIKISPLVGESSMLKIFKIVLFPDPDFPLIEISPFEGKT